MNSRLETFAAIHLVVPAMGVVEFVALLWRMRRAGVGRALGVPYFLIHVFYGGLLLIVLTALFWEWSGLASLGVFACVFLGPVILSLQAWRLRKGMRDSRFHAVAIVLSALYPLCLAALVVWALRAT
jgi:hypothetical protein